MDCIHWFISCLSSGFTSGVDWIATPSVKDGQQMAPTHAKRYLCVCVLVWGTQYQHVCMCHLREEGIQLGKILGETSVVHSWELQRWPSRPPSDRFQLYSNKVPNNTVQHSTKYSRKTNFLPTTTLILDDMIKSNSYFHPYFIRGSHYVQDLFYKRDLAKVVTVQNHKLWWNATYKNVGVIILYRSPILSTWLNCGHLFKLVDKVQGWGEPVCVQLCGHNTCHFELQHFLQHLNKVRIVITLMMIRIRKHSVMLEYFWQFVLKDSKQGLHFTLRHILHKGKF